MAAQVFVEVLAYCGGDEQGPKIGIEYRLDHGLGPDDELGAGLCSLVTVGEQVIENGV